MAKMKAKLSKTIQTLEAKKAGYWLVRGLSLTQNGRAAFILAEAKGMTC